jgi:6,7-dimethyl-8-ribityllumazine synthase
VSERDGWPEAPPLEDPPGDEEEAAEPEGAAELEEVELEEVDEAVVIEEPEAEAEATEHAPGDFAVPDGYGVLEGSAQGGRRAVGIVVSRFNGNVTGRLLEGALAELDTLGVARDAITIMPVPGAFELPIAAMALAKTRRYACIVALGCVIRGDTPHFEYVAGEAASGLQLAGLETGVPVSFGVLTCDSRRQAEERAGGPQGNKGSEAALSALEMADLLTRLRPAATP